MAGELALKKQLLLVLMARKASTSASNSSTVRAAVQGSERIRQAGRGQGARLLDSLHQTSFAALDVPQPLHDGVVDLVIFPRVAAAFGGLCWRRLPRQLQFDGLQSNNPFVGV